MKVSLAAQTLSESVSTSLQYLNEANYPCFDNCKATVNLILIFNNLFDVLNSKPNSEKDCKRPLSSETAKVYFEYFNYAKTNILKLKLEPTVEQKSIL